MSNLKQKPATGFSKTQRLLTAKQYKQVFTNPKKLTTSNLTCLYCPSAENYARLGVIVAKKNIRLAVDRNRLKRILRESFRLNQSELPAMDCVILVRRGSSELPNQVLFDQLEGLWKKMIKRCAGY